MVQSAVDWCACQPSSGLTHYRWWPVLLKLNQKLQDAAVVDPTCKQLDRATYRGLQRVHVPHKCVSFILANVQADYRGSPMVPLFMKTFMDDQNTYTYIADPVPELHEWEEVFRAARWSSIPSRPTLPVENVTNMLERYRSVFKPKMPRTYHLLAKSTINNHSIWP